MLCAGAPPPTSLAALCEAASRTSSTSRSLPRANDPLKTVSWRVTYILLKRLDLQWGSTAYGTLGMQGPRAPQAHKPKRRTSLDPDIFALSPHSHSKTNLPAPLCKLQELRAQSLWRQISALLLGANAVIITTLLLLRLLLLLTMATATTVATTTTTTTTGSSGSSGSGGSSGSRGSSSSSSSSSSRSRRRSRSRSSSRRRRGGGGRSSSSNGTTDC